jgi:hypothetical protein
MTSNYREHEFNECNYNFNLPRIIDEFCTTEIVASAGCQNVGAGTQTPAIQSV